MKYNDEMQELFIKFLITDHQLFARCQNIIDPTYFKAKYYDAVDFVAKHAQKHSAVPTLDQINSISDIKFEKLDEAITDSHEDWFLESFETFCRHMALEDAITKAPALLRKGDYGTVQTMIDQASQVGLVKDLGIEYYENPVERLERIKNNRGAQSTGWAEMDKKLFGGLNRGELTLFAGIPGAGKSLFLQNIGINWAEMGLNVMYVTLELSQDLIALRLDAMNTGMTTREVLRNHEDAALKVSLKGKSAGRYRLKYLPAGSTANDMRSLLREYEIEQGEKVDALLIDYLDEMGPISKQVNLGDVYTKDKLVSSEVRTLAVEKDILCVSASQLNRSAMEELEFAQNHIAGGISKNQITDNLIGIFTSNAMREKGRYQLQFLKTRSSTGVGQSIDLKYDPNTMRIVDLDEDDEDATTVTSASLLEQLKDNKVMKNREEPEQPAPGLDQMREFLKKNTY